MKKIFLDANIILDFLDSTRPFHAASKDTIRHITENGAQIVITEDLLTTIYYVTKDKIRLLDFYSVILDFWDVIAFGKERLSEAVSICKADLSLNFEDVIQSLSARDSNCDLIISNDAGFYNCGIEIISSSDFNVSR